VLVLDIADTGEEIIRYIEIQRQQEHISYEADLLRKCRKHEIALRFRDKSEFLQSFTVSFAEQSSSADRQQRLLVLPSDLPRLRVHA